MLYPNKTFILDTEVTGFGDQRYRHFVIIAAKNKEVAAMYINEKLSGNVHPNELNWLINTDHITMYDQTGNKELNPQAKILYNTTVLIGG